MASFSYFVKPCPACGRHSQIALQYLGKMVRCRHCGRAFMADDSTSQSESLNDRVDYWIKYSEQFANDLAAEGFSSRLPR